MNAVIMAAGTASRFAPLSYEKPKGLLEVKGEVLIERQIRQLKETGINDITVVVGYKQELYFFLVDKWGVNLEINTDLKKNNIFSLYMAKNFLGSTYILNCDNYFEEIGAEETKRYFEDKTQMETAKLLGISQVQVSRLEKKILLKMRKNIQS